MKRRETLAILGQLPAGRRDGPGRRDRPAGRLPRSGRAGCPTWRRPSGTWPGAAPGYSPASPGNRPIHLVTYGEPLPRGKATANYNSACGGATRLVRAAKDGTQRPVVFLLGPVHGGEFEGVVGLLEPDPRGRDRRGLARRPWPELAGEPRAAAS